MFNNKAIFFPSGRNFEEGVVYYNVNNMKFFCSNLDCSQCSILNCSLTISENKKIIVL